MLKKTFINTLLFALFIGGGSAWYAYSSGGGSFKGYERSGHYERGHDHDDDHNDD